MSPWNGITFPQWIEQLREGVGEWLARRSHVTKSRIQDFLQGFLIQAACCRGESTCSLLRKWDFLHYCRPSLWCGFVIPSSLNPSFFISKVEVIVLLFTGPLWGQMRLFTWTDWKLVPSVQVKDTIGQFCYTAESFLTISKALKLHWEWHLTKSYNPKEPNSF